MITDLKESIRINGHKWIRSVEFHRHFTELNPNANLMVNRAEEGMLSDVLDDARVSSASTALQTGANANTNITNTNLNNKTNIPIHFALSSGASDMVMVPEVPSKARGVGHDINGGSSSSHSSVSSIGSGISVSIHSLPPATSIGPGPSRSADGGLHKMKSAETAVNRFDFPPHPAALQNRSKSVPKLESMTKLPKRSKDVKRKKSFLDTRLFTRRNSFGRDRAINKSGLL